MRHCHWTIVFSAKVSSCGDGFWTLLILQPCFHSFFEIGSKISSHRQHICVLLLPHTLFRSVFNCLTLCKVLVKPRADEWILPFLFDIYHLESVQRSRKKKHLLHPTNDYRVTSLLLNSMTKEMVNVRNDSINFPKAPWWHRRATLRLSQHRDYLSDPRISASLLVKTSCTHLELLFGISGFCHPFDYFTNIVDTFVPVRRRFPISWHDK